MHNDHYVKLYIIAITTLQEISHLLNRLTQSLVEIGRVLDLPNVDQILLSHEGYFLKISSNKPQSELINCSYPRKLIEVNKDIPTATKKFSSITTE